MLKFDKVNLSETSTTFKISKVMGLTWKSIVENGDFSFVKGKLNLKSYDFVVLCMRTA